MIVIVIVHLITISGLGVVVNAQIEVLKHKILTTGKINDSLKDKNGNKIWLLSGHWKVTYSIIPNLMTQIRVNFQLL
jgi:hypothetical protein